MPHDCDLGLGGAPRAEALGEAPAPPGFHIPPDQQDLPRQELPGLGLYDSAKLLYEEGVRRYFIITTDSDFVRIAQMLNSKEKSYIIGVGTKQASETLRNAYDEFIVYPAEEKETVRKKHTRKNAETAEKAEEALEKAEPKANKKAETKKDVKSKKAKQIKPRRTRKRSR